MLQLEAAMGTLAAAEGYRSNLAAAIAEGRGVDFVP